MNERLKLALLSGFLGVPAGVACFWGPELLDRYTSIHDDYVLAVFIIELFIANTVALFILSGRGSRQLGYLQLVLFGSVFAITSSVSAVIAMIFAEGLTPNDHVILGGFGIITGIQLLFSVIMAIVFKRKKADPIIEDSISSFGMVEKDYNFEE